jgi:2-C-methyl-D-erythritol 4-phosphate cytidylyltransferase
LNIEYAIIVAGGKGTRINSEVPKQFLEVNGLPVLMHTINAFLDYSKSLQIILVLPEDEISTWKRLCDAHSFKVDVTLQTGGATRFQSVKRGLEKITGEGLVAVHDGVRPLVRKELIAATFSSAARHGAAVAAVRPKESLREDIDNTTRAVDRSRYWMVQTPQTFRASLLRKAYQLEEDATLTDDASVVERYGYAITLVEGHYDNIKITTAEDLEIVSFSGSQSGSVLVFVEEEIFLGRIIRPDFFNALVWLAVVLQFLEVLNDFKRRA